MVTSPFAEHWVECSPARLEFSALALPQSLSSEELYCENYIELYCDIEAIPCTCAPQAMAVECVDTRTCTMYTSVHNIHAKMQYTHIHVHV